VPGEGKLRLLVAPFIFVLSLAVGLYFEDESHDRFLAIMESKNALALLGLIVAASIPIGFLMRQLTIAGLWLLFLPSKQGFDASYSDWELSALNKASGTPAPKRDFQGLHRTHRRELEQYADLTFISGSLGTDRPRVFSWIGNVWDIYYASANNVTALVLAVFVGMLVLKIGMSWQWGLLTMFMLTVNLPTAVRLWHKTMLFTVLEALRTNNRLASEIRSKTQLKQRSARRRRAYWLSVAALGVATLALLVCHYFWPGHYKLFG